MCKNYYDQTESYKELEEKDKAILDKWIKGKFQLSKRTYAKGSSYGLKHDFERETGIYVYNGQFKAAMIRAGFTAIYENEQNWHFKMKERIPNSFYRFCIRRYKYNDSSLGDFVRDMEKAPEFPKESIDKTEIKDYLYSKHACLGAMKAFEKAWKHFEKNKI
ncbi:uncharacterized protein YozE (UPF0346 family) [Clostridium algifaecis]|uniref:Uncharacterized protein YozE (UPF0346 family) n=1 Tax=Clostridium algifaecis TaxID=1472040 RepID=A0ABS4KTU2_9CLOT|nr:sterile alpha motif-like domain-containing protein [Clostridium algifaecis]MBP2033468.1 uncharacterized protein YozE (UPF0346 family) [Clostridium algifaecis]